MRRLAFTYEALVSVVADRENRVAAAFVAGAAHHVTLLAARVSDPTPRQSRLGYQGISAEISAALLFLIAEASADAAEMAKSITVETADPVEAALIRSISHLAAGRLREILETPVPTAEQILAVDGGSRAVRTLYFLLLRGVRVLAASLLGEIDSLEPSNASAQELFKQAKTLCVEPLGDTLSGLGGTPYSLFPGPLHLASLLLSVATDLSASSLVGVIPPDGLDGGRWFGLMQEMAERRPYLWRNHLQAIAAGYLRLGISAAVSFPTGAGKSTLAELKIATALLRGAKVVFLAPTLALVDQTARALAGSFPKADVQKERAEEVLFDFDSEALPAISVMTPERCLAILSFDPEIFSDVGLMVFDECHLLHPRETDRSRRAIDAMLCVLNFTAVAPESDLLLLSAMMKNCTEIAGWIESLTGRPCLALALTWKPTRQVRGCVVYGESEIGPLKQKLREARAKVKNKHPPATLKRSLTVQPFGFFCLNQTWNTRARGDYALLPLLSETVALGTGTSPRDGSWYLTPNGNEVAADLATATARQKLKTLVFTQTIPYANKASTTVSEQLGTPGVVLTDAEKMLHAAAADEAGATQVLYLQLDSHGALASSSACHHGLLLPVERQLHESLFRRPDGIHVLVATSTLAQGMNLPSEVVIIGGDSRFDQKADRMEQLEAHELLNAAGRAGRAGDSSYGFVLVIPSKVVNFDNEKNTIHNHWTELQAIFAQSDQCLVIEDPLSSLLDQIHAATEPASDAVTYLIRRLPVGGADGSNSDAPARTLLDRSFAAYSARRRGDDAWVESRVASALSLRRADPTAPTTLTWADRLAAAAGVRAETIYALGTPLSAALDPRVSVSEWYNWVVSWLSANPNLIPQFIRRESLEGLFGKQYRVLTDDAQRGQYAAPRLFSLLVRWMRGETLVELERAFGTKESQLGHCEAAREFVLRVIPDLAYLFGLPAQVVRALGRERGDNSEPPLALAMLGSCVKEGFDAVEKLALRHSNNALSRRRAHYEFAVLAPYLHSGTIDDNFPALLQRVELALRLQRASHKPR